MVGKEGKEPDKFFKWKIKIMSRVSLSSVGYEAYLTRTMLNVKQIMKLPENFNHKIKL